MRLLRLVLALFPTLYAVSAAAGDYVVSKGKLSDQSFYRLVACAAPPGQACKNGMIHWAGRRVSIGIVDIDDRLSKSWITKSENALQNAIAQINAAGANIELESVGVGVPDIQVYLTADRQVRKHSIVRDIGHRLGGPSTGVARVFFTDNKINRALVVIAVRGNLRELNSVMLEEVVQSLGLITDIRNRYYRRRSIFSETGSGTTELRGQDAKSLRLHYPSH